jgi:hypothetical protein
LTELRTLDGKEDVDGGLGLVSMGVKKGNLIVVMVLVVAILALGENLLESELLFS